MEFVKAENIRGKCGVWIAKCGLAEKGGLRMKQVHSAIRIPKSAGSGGDRGTAGLLELGLGGTGELLGGDLERAADFAVAEDLEKLHIGADDAGLGQHLGIHFGDLGIE